MYNELNSLLMKGNEIINENSFNLNEATQI